MQRTTTDAVPHDQQELTRSFGGGAATATGDGRAVSSPAQDGATPQVAAQLGRQQTQADMHTQRVRIS